MFDYNKGFKLLLNQNIKCGNKISSYLRMLKVVKQLKVSKVDDLNIESFLTLFERVEVFAKIILQKKGSMAKQIPVALSEKNRLKLGLKLLKDSLKRRDLKNKKFSDSFYNEVLNILIDKDSFTLLEKKRIYNSVIENRSNISLKR